MTTLAAAYQETFRHNTNIPYVSIENDRIRKFYKRAGKDVENFISSDVQRLINEFKALPDEEQMKIITQIDQMGKYVRGLPDFGLKDIKKPYRYNDLIAMTPSFEDIARLIRVPEAVRRQYPPAMVFGYFPIFSVVDILARSASELNQLTVEKADFRMYNADFAQRWGTKGETEVGGGAAGTYTRIDGRVKVVESAIDSATFETYYLPIWKAAQMNGAKIDFKKDEHMNAYLNATIPAKVNFVTTTNINKADGTWDSKSYYRMLSSDGISRWVHFFTKKLSNEEAQMDYARYGDYTKDVRVRMDDKELSGFVVGTTVRNDIAIATMLDGKFGSEQSKAAGVAFRPWKESNGTIEDAKIYAKVYDVINAEKRRSKEVAGSLIGKDIEISAGKEVEGTGREAYVLKWLKGKGYYETAYYNFIKEKGGSLYLKYGEIGKLMNAWVLARCISNEHSTDPSLVSAVDIEGAGNIQLTTSSDLTTAKFVGKQTMFEAASGEKIKLFNSMLNLRGTGAGLEIKEEEHQRTLGVGATFPLGAHIATIRETLFFDPLNSSGIGWFIGSNLYQHEPVSWIALTTGESFKDVLADEKVFRANLAGFWRARYDEEAFLVVDWKRNTSNVTDLETINKKGIKGGLTYYDIKASGTYSLTASLSGENDSVSNENVTSFNFIGKKVAFDTRAIEVKYTDKQGKEKTGEFTVKILYSRPF